MLIIKYMEHRQIESILRPIIIHEIVLIYLISKDCIPRVFTCRMTLINIPQRGNQVKHIVFITQLIIHALNYSIYSLSSFLFHIKLRLIRIPQPSKTLHILHSHDKLRCQETESDGHNKQKRTIFPTKQLFWNFLKAIMNHIEKYTIGSESTI